MKPKGPFGVATNKSLFNIVLLFVGIGVLAGCGANGVKRGTMPGVAPVALADENLADENDAQQSQATASTSISLDEIKGLIIEKQYPMAEAKLRLRTARMPEDATAWANLGLVLSETNRLSQAEQVLRKAVTINERFAAAYLRLAAVMKKQGEIKQALDLNKKAVEIDPQYANAHYNLAILYDLYYEDVPRAHTHLVKYLENIHAEDKEATAWLAYLQRKLDKQQEKTPSEAPAVKSESGE